MARSIALHEVAIGIEYGHVMHASFHEEPDRFVHGNRQSVCGCSLSDLIADTKPTSVTATMAGPP